MNAHVHDGQGMTPNHKSVNTDLVTELLSDACTPLFHDCVTLEIMIKSNKTIFLIVESMKCTNVFLCYDSRKQNLYQPLTSVWPLPCLASQPLSFSASQLLSYSASQPPFWLPWAHLSPGFENVQFLINAIINFDPFAPKSGSKLF